VVGVETTFHQKVSDSQLVTSHPIVLSSLRRAPQPAYIALKATTRALTTRPAAKMEQKPDFETGVNYWANTEASVNGVLGGYGE
jgi:protein N-terminal methyltransferase